MKRLVLTGGGTGGHIYPALALGEAFLAGGQGRELLFIGSRKGMEARLVPQAGLPFLGLPARGFRGKPLGEKLLFSVDLVRGLARADAALGRFRPEAVLATGSFASLPTLIAARRRGLPIFLQEQNSVPGRVIKLFSGRARLVFLAYQEAAAQLSRRARCELTGNPVRREFLALAARRRAEGLPAERRLLLFGGSRGARSLNRAAREALPALVARFDFEAVVQTGEADLAATREALAPLAPAVRVVPYLDDMPAVMARAQVAVCRAGAMTLAELTLLGLPAVLVPFPHAVDDHQTRNAEVLAAAGAARLVPDRELDGARLAAELAALWSEPERLRAMSAASAALGRPDATAAALASMEKSLVGLGGG